MALRLMPHANSASRRVRRSASRWLPVWHHARLAGRHPARRPNPACQARPNGLAHLRVWMQHHGRWSRLHSAMAIDAQRRQQRVRHFHAHALRLVAVCRLRTPFAPAVLAWKISNGAAQLFTSEHEAPSDTARPPSHRPARADCCARPSPSPAETDRHPASIPCPSG